MILNKKAKGRILSTKGSFKDCLHLLGSYESVNHKVGKIVYDPAKYFLDLFPKTKLSEDGLHLLFLPHISFSLKKAICLCSLYLKICVGLH